MMNSPASNLQADTPGTLVLVVEDEQNIRELLCDVLESEGYSTHALESADLALEYLNLQSEHVGLLLTDINMPGTINGAGLAKASQLLWPAIPILVMSGFETLESAGIDHTALFIRKPFTVNAVLARIHTALDGLE